MQSQTLDVLVNGWKGKVFYNPHLPTARKDAEEYARPHGKILSLPELIDGIMKTPSLLMNPYTTKSEEVVLRSQKGKNYLYLFHGCGVLTARRAALAWKRRPLEGEEVALLTDKENNELFEGRLANGGYVPVYSMREFWQNDAFPEQYAIVLDTKTVRRTLSGRQRIDDLYENPLFVPRIGSTKRAVDFLDGLRRLHTVFPSQMYGNLHPYGAVDFPVPQARILYLGAGTNGVCSVFSGVGGFPAVKVQIIEM